MPLWIVTALTLLRSLGSRLISTPARALATGATGGFSLPGGFPSFFGDGGDPDRPRRRRRRRALTNSDRDDIAFVAATISKTAAASFAVQLVTRSR